MDLPYDWDFLQDNLPPKSLPNFAGDSWRSGFPENIQKKR
jgi:hypothetical protein